MELALLEGTEGGQNHCGISPVEVRGIVGDRLSALDLRPTPHRRPDGLHWHPKEPVLPAHHLVHKQLASGKEN